MQRRTMTDDDVLYLLQHGVYTVNLQTAVVTGPRGKNLTPFGETNPGSSGTYWFVTLYAHEQRRTVALHKLVWMAGTMSVVPPNFQVHHRDRDTEHNAFVNLLCVHKIDHDKLHTDDEEVPF